MLNLLRYIQKAFSKPQLKNEDWLNPSDRVLANIEAEIQKDDKKEKPSFLYLITGLLFLFLVPSVLYFNIHNEELREVQSSSTTQERTIIKDDLSNRINHNEAVALNSVISGLTQKVDPIKNTESRIEIVDNRQIKLSQNAVVKLKEESTPQLSIQEKFIQNDNKIEAVLNRTTASSVKMLVTKEDVDKIDDTNFVPVALSENTIELVKYLEIQNLEVGNNALPELKTILVDFDIFPPNNFYVQASAGFSIWNFQLNDVYSDLVEPAAFTNTYGTGFNTSLQVGKNINNRFSLSAQLQYEDINFSSGHNSAIIFDNALAEQTQNLSMATPLGIVDNEVALLRTVDPSRGETNLIVDLHNDHHLQALAFSLAANINVVNRDKLRLSVSPSFGLLRILEASNTLSSIDTHDASILDGGSLVEGGFENINTTSPIISLNMDFSKPLGKDWEVGTQLGGSVNLKPIQETGDLKTNVSRFGIQILLRRNF